MALLVGMDEAGLGPNLGPYVVTATVWEVPGDADDVDLWAIFSDILTSTPQRGDPRLHFGDSKAVFQPGKGLKALEAGVLTTLSLREGELPETDRQLRRAVSSEGTDRMEADPWYAGENLPIPLESCHEEIANHSARWRKVLEAEGIRLQGIHCTILEPARFNELMARHQNKSTALSTASLALLRHAVPDVSLTTHAWCDKHGGRNRYDLLLTEAFDGEFVFRLKESAECSTYRIGNLEVQFQPRAEEHFPVAVASMVSKYVRELAMCRFNRYWQEKVPGLKPTQGYPVDARRFVQQITAAVQQLGLSPDQIWRCR